MRALKSTGLILLTTVALSACGDDSQVRLNEALNKEGIKDITVTDAAVKATCAGGTTANVDASELERNFLGMVKSERVRVVANKLYQQCDKADQEKMKVQRAKEMINDAAKQLGIDVSALDDNTAKKAICDKLVATLPLKDPDRTVEDVKNQNKWGCAPAPPVADLPTGAWQVESPPPQGKKPVTSYLRLSNDNGDKLTVRCLNKKSDFYLQTSDVAKKGTKTIDVKMGNAPKPAKWKVKPSTDGKALFFVDTKPAFAAIGIADAVTFSIVGAKKPFDVAFKSKGFGEALKKLPKGCS